MTYEEYKDQFVDHIEGRATNERRQADSDEEQENKSSKSKKGKKTISGHSDNEGTENDPSNMSLKSGDRGTSQNKSQLSLNKKSDNSYKYELPEVCLVNLLKSSKIEKLSDKYLLLVHPFPIVEGEMIILQPKKEDQKERDLIVYRDYSLRKRLCTKEKVREDFFTRKEKGESNEDVTLSKLQCLEIDNDSPLAMVEWKNLAEVVNEVQGLAWFQILPVGQKSSQPLQFNLLHVLPNAKIPVNKLPLDVMISNAVSYQRKLDRKVGAASEQTNLERADLEDQARQ